MQCYCMECHCIECCKNISISFSLNLIREGTYWNSDVFVLVVSLCYTEFPFERQKTYVLSPRSGIIRQEQMLCASDPANSRFSSLVCTFSDKLCRFNKGCINCPFPQKKKICMRHF